MLFIGKHQDLLHSATQDQEALEEKLNVIQQLRCELEVCSCKKSDYLNLLVKALKATYCVAFQRRTREP